MEIRETGIPGLMEIIAPVFQDDRGWFSEGYRKSILAKAGIMHDFPQDNLSWSRCGVIRGLHFQRAPFAQAKLVTVLAGSVLDVVVDLRPDSPTFRKTFYCHLSAAHRNMLFVPEGFAHGFRALEDSLFSYKCSAEYAPSADGGVRWNDPELAIDWRLSEGEQPVISAKDQALPLLSELIESQRL